MPDQPQTSQDPMLSLLMGAGGAAIPGAETPQAVPPMPQAPDAQKPVNSVSQMGGLALLAASGNQGLMQMAAQMMAQQSDDVRKSKAQQDYQKFQMQLQARTEAQSANAQATERNFTREQNRTKLATDIVLQTREQKRADKIREEDITRGEAHYKTEQERLDREEALKLSNRKYEIVNDTIGTLLKYQQGKGIDMGEFMKSISLDPGYIGEKNKAKRQQYLMEKMQMWQQMSGNETVDPKILSGYLDTQMQFLPPADREDAFDRIKTMLPMVKSEEPTGLESLPPDTKALAMGLTKIMTIPLVQNRVPTSQETADMNNIYGQFLQSPHGQAFFNDKLGPMLVQNFKEHMGVDEASAQKMVAMIGSEVMDNASQSQVELTVPNFLIGASPLTESVVKGVGSFAKSVAGYYSPESTKAAIQRGKEKRLKGKPADATGRY